MTPLALLLAVIRVGIIGLDTSHALAFTKIMNVDRDPDADGFRMVAAYQWGSKDIVSSTNRYPKYIAQMKDMGVEIVPTIDDLLAKADCVCLETNDGREHLWQAEKVFRAGKPCFIDKPLAHNLRDAKRIYDLGLKYGAKYFSSSCLRYGKVVQAARNGEYGPIRTIALTSPAPIEEQGTHNFYSWYGIHGFEPFVTVMRTGAEKVSCFRNEKDDVINVRYGDGRMAQLHLFRDGWTYAGFVMPEKPADSKRPVVLTDGNPGYLPLFREIVKFFRTGVVPVPPEETLEIFALMEAAEMSAKRGGEPVALAEAFRAARPDPTVPADGFANPAGAVAVRDFTPETRDGVGVQKAIDAAAAAGGGRVVLEKATYPSGTLYLKSNVELHLPEGATLLGHDAPGEYDDVDDPRIGKLPENSKKVFIVAMDATNVAITGRGTIDGQGPKFYDRNIPPGRDFYLKPPHPRPRMVEMYKCRNVRFEGVLFKDSPGWTFWIRNCEDVVAKGIRIHGDQRMINNDGLHFDGCKRMRVLGCDFRTGDDSIVFRAIEPPDHDPYDALGEDLYVADCTIDSACQGVRLGCPSDNTIRKAVFTNCVFRGRTAVSSGHPVRYIRKGTGFPKGNCRMEDILFVDCSVDVSGAPIRFFAEDGVALRKYGNVTFRRMALKGGEAITLTGNPEAVVENVRFEDVTGEIADRTPVLMNHARNISFERFDVSCVPPRPGKADRRVKIGLYCDQGSRGDNVVRWTRLLDGSPDVALTLLEGADLRSGALAGLDLLVMPGGSGYDQYESMGEDGARAIRDYVRGGGRYLGTCAGLALLLNEPRRVALLPLRRIDGHFRRGGGDLGVAFNDAGMEALGITNRIWAVRYHNGPIVVPAADVEGTVCETWATCRNGIHEQGVSPKRDDMVGTPAFVRATCGKGEVIACNCHPEAYPATRELVVAMIRALTGRTIHPPAKYFRSYRGSGKGALNGAVRYNE